MGKIVISNRIILEPVQMMGVVLVHVENILTERGEDPMPLKEKILAAGTISEIQAIVYEAVGDEIIIDA